MTSVQPGAVTTESAPEADQAQAPAGSAITLARRVVAALAGRPWLAAWLAFLPLAVLRAGDLSEADTFWEIRTGLITLGQRAIPAVDSFTWTMRGKPLTLNSWGFNVVIAIAYKLAGLPAVALACLCLTMVIIALMLLLARHLGAAPAVAGAAVLVTAPLLIGWLTARPQLVDYAAILILVLLLKDIAEGRPAGWRVAVAGLLAAVWVNLHAGALFGVILSAAAGVLLLLRRDMRGRALWCLAAATVMLAVSFVNPYGTGLLAQTWQVQADSSGLIVEWQHLNPLSPGQDLTIALGLAALVIVARQRDAVLTAGLAIGLAGSVTAIRFLPFLVVLAVPVVAAAASHPVPLLLRYVRSRRLMLIRCGAIGMLAFIAVAVPSLAHIGRPDNGKYPVAITGDIPRGCRVFTSDLIGGYLILARPDAPVSLDTRNTLYGRQMLLAEERTLAGRGNLARGLAGAGCVLVPPASGLARQLGTDAAWRRIASDPPSAVLFVRR